MVAARFLLAWLETFPGDTWQQRWDASPAAAARQRWFDHPRAWGESHGRRPDDGALGSALLTLVCADVIRPSMTWLVENPSSNLRNAMVRARDPEGFAQLQASIPAHELATRRAEALTALARLLAAHGGRIEDIVVGDLLKMLQHARRASASAVRLAYVWLRDRGHFPPDAPATLAGIANRSGQLSPAALVDRYDLRCKPMRDLLVAYLTERQPALDYNTLRQLSSHLAGSFWSDLERHHPGIDSLHIAAQISDGWKARISLKVVRTRRPDGTFSEVTARRISAPSIKLAVRAFYLDIAHWALGEPERWGVWAAPCPISEADCAVRKTEQEQKARSHERTRERLPAVPVLVRGAERRLKEATARLAALDAAPLGSTITVLGETLTLPSTTSRPDGRASDAVDATGAWRKIRPDEKRAFWTWASIEILRFTGIRIEELLELGHHSIISYRLPSTGEVIPLLQIAPSKTDQERLLLVSPELADVLSAVISRVRGASGKVPSIQTYDMGEKIWNPPMPILYQWAVSGENRPISVNVIRRGLDEALAATGLVDKTGKPLQFQPHDFRRIFITDAILNGFPPHLAQVIAGHGHIGTTMGYAAIYPTDAIEAHRAFIARRRSLRPPEEYRAVTPEEWQEFLGHFERRKLALGECGRAYGTDCAHEHACVRCPVLIVDPAERNRLEEIRDNLNSRIAEAEREGWLGEVEGLCVSRDAAEEKIMQLDARQEKKESPVFLGIPRLDQITVRSAQH
ncbi:tyrosine-type recombinase/integrase [Kitasatospora sp. NPDC101447]|uniref:tyrosine-type recombinase/integrase n=1 Tax=Kitasatospora sp. NPDC101447 TaxID=3364102 RepID=UPI0038305FD2